MVALLKTLILHSHQCQGEDRLASRHIGDRVGRRDAPEVESADDAAMCQLNDEQALIATTDLFMPIVHDPIDDR